jgi:uncharacterized phiE125 gp8 family phage protein
LDFDGQARNVDPQNFVIDPGRSMLAFRPSVLPMPTKMAAGIELDVMIGFGDSAADVPETLRQAMRLLVAHWYENRGLIATGTQIAALPASAAALLSPYRILAL